MFRAAKEIWFLPESTQPAQHAVVDDELISFFTDLWNHYVEVKLRLGEDEGKSENYRQVDYLIRAMMLRKFIDKNWNDTRFEAVISRLKRAASDGELELLQKYSGMIVGGKIKGVRHIDFDGNELSEGEVAHRIEALLYSYGLHSRKVRNKEKKAYDAKDSSELYEILKWWVYRAEKVGQGLFDIIKKRQEAV